MDSKGQGGLSFYALTRLLFRVAHSWCTNVDLDEYVDFLFQLYARICSRFACDKGSDYEVFPRINVQFPNDELKYKESGGDLAQGGDNNEWLECRSDESNKSDYDYKYEEDPDNMMVKKYKKMKNDFGKIGESNSQGTIVKEPFLYIEEVDYSQD